MLSGSNPYRQAHPLGIVDLGLESRPSKANVKRRLASDVHQAPMGRDDPAEQRKHQRVDSPRRLRPKVRFSLVGRRRRWLLHRLLVPADDEMVLIDPPAKSTLEFRFARLGPPGHQSVKSLP